MYKVLLLTLSMPLLASTTNIETQSLFTLLVGAFGAGILLTFTPCVLPMIPILSSVIAGQGKSLTKTKAFGLSLAYVLGTAITYAIMGALAGATGDQLQSYFQNVWVISSFSFLFVIMAFAMFGIFEIALPASLQTKLNSASGKFKGGSFAGVFLLGLLSALVLGACVSPVLISFLSVAIATSNPLLGAQTMFFLALGMGVPLLFVGMGAGYLVPKAGAWMNSVKYFFGTLLLGVAIFIFSELELVSSLLLWGIYLIGIGIYLGLLEISTESLNGWQRLKKTVAFLSLLWGVLLMVGASKGNSDLLKPLQNINKIIATVTDKETSQQTNNYPFEYINNLKGYNTTKALAFKEHKPIIIFFHAKHCKVCKKIDETTLKNLKVKEILKEKYIALAVDLTDKTNKQTNAIKKKLKVFGAPAFVLIDEDGEVQGGNILYGYQPASELYDQLDMN